MLKSVKMHFSDNTEILGFKRVHYFFTGFRISFGYQTGTLEIVILEKKRK